MIIGILSFRDSRYHPNRRLIEASEELGNKAVLLNPRKIFMGVDDLYYYINSVKGCSVNVDIIIPRIGSTIKEYPLTMIRQFELTGIVCINGYESIMISRNKFLTLQSLINAGVPVIESRYVSNITNFKYAYKDLGGRKVVVKLAQGRQGKGVFLVDSLNMVEKIFGDQLGRLTECGLRHIGIQK